jgi:hypothetical protein
MLGPFICERSAAVFVAGNTFTVHDVAGATVTRGANASFRRWFAEISARWTGSGRPINIWVLVERLQAFPTRRKPCFILCIRIVELLPWGTPPFTVGSKAVAGHVSGMGAPIFLVPCEVILQQSFSIGQGIAAAACRTANARRISARTAAVIACFSVAHEGRHPKSLTIGQDGGIVCVSVNAADLKGAWFHCCSPLCEIGVGASVEAPLIVASLPGAPMISIGFAGGAWSAMQPASTLRVFQKLLLLAAPLSSSFVWLYR